MKRFRYETVTAGSVDQINWLLTRGWRPVRESLVMPGDEGGAATVLVLLERDDALPTWQGEMLTDGIPLSFLEDAPLLADLSEQELREFVAAAEPLAFAEEDVLFEQGHQEQSLFVLLSGEVDIHLVGLPIEDPVVLKAKARDVFGESTFFAPAAHTARGVAVSSGQALRLRRSQYDVLRQAERLVAFKLAENAARILGTRLQETDEWVREILEEDQNAQIAHSWQRFRRRMSGPSDSSYGFVHI